MVSGNFLTRIAPRRATHLIYRQMKDLLGQRLGIGLT